MTGRRVRKDRVRMLEEGPKLRAIRAGTSMTIEELAHHAETGKSTVGKWERGEQEAQLERLREGYLRAGHPAAASQIEQLRAPQKREAPQVTHEAAPSQKPASTRMGKHPWTQAQWEAYLATPEGQALQEKANGLPGKIAAMQGAMEAQSSVLAKLEQLRNRGML